MKLLSNKAVPMKQGQFIWLKCSRRPDFRVAITVKPENQATEWCRTKEDVEILERILVNNYLNKKVNAVLAAVPKTTAGRKRTEYAIFCEDGFLVAVPEE